VGVGGFRHLVRNPKHARGPAPVLPTRDPCCGVNAGIRISFKEREMSLPPGTNHSHRIAFLVLGMSKHGTITKGLGAGESYR
jgi:hypothetical protein